MLMNLVVMVSAAVGQPNAGGWHCDRPAPTLVREWRVEDGGNGHRYAVVVSPDGISWSHAAYASEILGGHLVTPTSVAENAFVFSIIAGVDEAWSACETSNGRTVMLGPWIGAMQSDDGNEPDGGWKWCTGEAWSDPQWAPHEPNEHPDAPASSGENRAHYLGLGQAGSRGSVIRRSPFWNDMPDRPEGTRGEPGLRVVAFVVEYPPEG